MIVLKFKIFISECSTRVGWYDIRETKTSIAHNMPHAPKKLVLISG